MPDQSPICTDPLPETSESEADMNTPILPRLGRRRATRAADEGLADKRASTRSASAFSTPGEGRTDPISTELGEDRYGLNIAQGMKVFTVEEAHAMRPELRVWLKQLDDERRFQTIMVDNRHALGSFPEATNGRASNESFDEDDKALLPRMVEIRGKITSMGL